MLLNWHLYYVIMFYKFACAELWFLVWRSVENMKVFLKILSFIVLSLATSFYAVKLVKYIMSEFFPQYMSTDSDL